VSDAGINQRSTEQYLPCNANIFHGLKPLWSRLV
jgi:hypothetical protein